MSFVTLKEVQKNYGSTNALRGVDLQVEEGQWVSIMGSSGCGKTTLLNIMGGLDTPTTGDVIVDSSRIDALSENELALFRREKIGFVFQNARLVSHLNAVENVMLAQYFHSMADEQEAVASLEKVGLKHRLTHRPSQLSGGEQQRVCIARALINSPRLLLADEPTGNLDKKNSTIILELLKDIHDREKFTLIVVTHEQYVTNWSQRILHMEDGLILKDELCKPRN